VSNCPIPRSRAASIRFASTRALSSLVAPALALVLTAMPQAAFAQTSDQAPQPTPNTVADTQQQLEVPYGLTGDWGGVRSDLHDDGIDISFDILSEVATNLSGGARRDATQTSGFTLGTTIDTQKLFGLKGGTFQATFTKRQGPALIYRAGLNTLMPAQEIYARGQTYRITDFWYKQKLGEVADIKLGRMTMGEDFAVLPCDFQNLSFCGNPVGNLVGNYWYNGPISQWAGVLRVHPGAFSFMVGVYEYNPRNLQQDFTLSHHGPKGVTIPVEAGWKPRLGPRGLPGSYRVGFWYNTDHAPDLLEGEDGLPFALTGADPMRRHGRYGAYVELQQQLTGTFVETAANGPKTTHGLSIFVNFTQADRRTTRTDSQAALWLVYAGPLKARPSDDMGFGVARTNVNGRAARAEALATPGSEAPDSEYTAEIYYGIHFKPWLVVRPNFQYVVNPGGYHKANDIAVLGLKSAITF
jgi:porin